MRAEAEALLRDEAEEAVYGACQWCPRLSSSTYAIACTSITHCRARMHDAPSRACTLAQVALGYRGATRGGGGRFGHSLLTARFASG